MDIKRAGSRPSGKGPAEYFAGAVRQDPVIEAPAPARVRAVVVTFEPGARTAWHTRPLGQTLFVLSGVGRAQTEGAPVREDPPGDTVWFGPGEKRWHGASPASRCATRDAGGARRSTRRIEHVADADYGAEPAL